MKTIKLAANVVMWAIVALSAIFAIAMIVKGEAIADAYNPLASAAGSWTGTIISWTIAVLIIGIVLALCSEIFGVIQNPSNILSKVALVVGAVILVGICWALSDATPLNLPGYEGDENQAPWLNIADTGIFLAYITGGCAVLAIIASEIYQMFK